jgi:anti-sigma-K factor RskA
MNCQKIDELLAAYSIAALDGGAMRDVQQHLSTCRRHDEALGELQAVSERLPLATEERGASPELRARLLSAFDDEVAAQRTPVSEPQRREPARIVPFVRRPAFARLAAAAMFVALIGLVAWNVALQTGDGGGDGWTVSASLTGTGVSGHLWYLDRQQLAVVKMDEMPPLSSGRVYQAWGIYNSGPVSLGVLPDEHTVAINANLTDASTFAITEEPAGGSDKPTSDPLAVAQLD